MVTLYLNMVLNDRGPPGLLISRSAFSSETNIYTTTRLLPPAMSLIRTQRVGEKTAVEALGGTVEPFRCDKVNRGCTRRTWRLTGSC